jgi:hypothetical protein
VSVGDSATVLLHGERVASCAAYSRALRSWDMRRSVIALLSHSPPSCINATHTATPYRVRIISVYTTFGANRQRRVTAYTGHSRCYVSQQTMNI